MACSGVNLWLSRGAAASSECGSIARLRLGAGSGGRLSPVSPARGSRRAGRGPGLGPGRGRHRCSASGRGAAPQSFISHRVRSCARLAAKIVPTCVRVPRPPAGPSASPAGPRRPHGVPSGKSRCQAGAGPGPAQQLTVRAQHRQPRRPSPAPRPGLARVTCGGRGAAWRGVQRGGRDPPVTQGLRA